MNPNEQAVMAMRTLSTDGLADVMARLSRGGVKFTLPMLPKHAIKQVIFNNPATVVLWSDGTKTVVKCSENDTFDPEIGLAMAICKKAFGNTGAYNEVFKKWVPETSELGRTTTVDEMRRKLVEYCRHNSCRYCKLGYNAYRCGKGAYFDIPEGSNGYMTDDEIRKAYDRVFGK